MKVSIYPALLSLMLTAALSYLAYYIGKEDENSIFLLIGTIISVLSTLALNMSVKFDNHKIGLNIKVWCTIMFFVLFIVNFCFAWLGVNVTYYIIIMTLLLVIHLFVVSKMFSTKNV